MIKLPNGVEIIPSESYRYKGIIIQSSERSLIERAVNHIDTLFATGKIMPYKIKIEYTLSDLDLAKYTGGYIEEYYNRQYTNFKLKTPIELSMSDVLKNASEKLKEEKA